MSLSLIQNFYSSFEAKNYRNMQSCYHDEIIFHDPVFQELEGKAAMAMWHMLVSNAKELHVSFHHAVADDEQGKCTWEADYIFSATNKPVHNIINASFAFKDGKIYRHNDHFPFWKWTRMALGTTGNLLGWTPLLQNKVRQQAATSLKKFIAAHPEYQ